ncbi:MAG: hypothetical protein OXC00_00765 [Acidimicrobiaceae bacterium]|nr:hypothetical protein [Acidimicrobiaceae bacterium]
MTRAETPPEPVCSAGSARRGGGLGVWEPALDGGFDLFGLVQRGDQRGELQVDLVDLGVERAVSLRRVPWSVSCSLLGVRVVTGSSGGWRLV